MMGTGVAPSSLTPGFVAAMLLFSVILGGCLFYLLPELRAFQQQTAAANDASIAIHIQMRALEERKKRDAADRQKFEALEKAGFLGEQNRLNAALTLERLRVRRRIPVLEYQINPVESTIIGQEMESGGVALGVSRVSLTLRGFLDKDMYDFAADLKRELPGYVSINAVEINRLAVPDPRMLAQISRGGGSELVGATMELSWQVVQPAQVDAGN